MVVGVDEQAATARVSCRLDGQSVVVELPLQEVSRRITASAGLHLDNLNSPNSRRRLQRQDGGWHFISREGLQGPYPSERDAARELARYVLLMQTAPAAGEGTARSSTAERSPQAERGRRASDPAQAEPLHASG